MKSAAVVALAALESANAFQACDKTMAFSNLDDNVQDVDYKVALQNAVWQNLLNATAFLVPLFGVLVPLFIVPLSIIFECLLVFAGAVGFYVARKLWRSIDNASGFVAKNKKLAVVILILVMLPFCGAVRVHGSGNAGPGDAC
jgi:hypothetical protein